MELAHSTLSTNTRTLRPVEAEVRVEGVRGDAFKSPPTSAQPPRVTIKLFRLVPHPCSVYVYN